MSMDPITKDDLDFMDIWMTPQAFMETMFHDWDNLNSFEPDSKFGELRLYQRSMLSDESIIDFELTGEHHNLSRKEVFQLRKNVGDIYCFGARKFGKSRITMIMDLLNDMMTSDGTTVALGSLDFLHIKQVLDPVKTALETHPICKLFIRRIVSSPDYQITLKNNYTLSSVNANQGSKSPGGQYLGKHVYKLYLEEASLEDEVVYEKRKDALSELGAIMRCIAQGSKILMSDMSSKNIEDVRIGDKILGWNDTTKALTESTVLNAACTGKKDVINIATDHNSLWLTPDHRILVNSEGDGVWRWVDAIYTYQNKYNVKQFPYITNLHEYYCGIFLGLFDSDGSLCKSNVTPIYRLHQSNEVEFFRFILNHLNFKFSEDIDKTPERSFAKPGKPGHTFRISTIHNDEIDQIQNNLFKSLDMQYGYLAGFIIGDGWIGKSGALDVTQCLKNEHKIEKLKHIADLAHVPYCFRINKEDVKKFFVSFHKYSFPFLSLEVKKCLTYRERILNTHRAYYPYSKVKLNGFKSQVDVYDLETTTSSFVANGFIVHNCSGMTDFTPQSPAGQSYYSAENHKHVLNYPQYVSPYWDENEKKRRIEQYGGLTSIGYRVYVGGEVVEDGITAFDMQRVRHNAIYENKKLSNIEISKDRFKHFKNFMVVERPVNAERIFISADIGLNVTEINIIMQVKDTYEYLYNITLNNLIDDEQADIFKYLASQLQANVIALDCGDGMGRAIYNELEKTIPHENLVWYAGTNKVNVGFALDKDGNCLVENGKPVVKEEFMSEWAVKRLKDLLYSGNLIIPEDHKFITQLSKVVAMNAGTRIVFKCISAQGDHLFDSFRVFAIAEWLRANTSMTPQISDDWGVGATN